MRHSASVLIPFIIMILATVIFVITTSSWLGAIDLQMRGKLAILLPFGSLAVAVFCLQQMSLPAPKLADDGETGSGVVDQGPPNEEANDGALPR